MKCENTLIVITIIIKFLGRGNRKKLLENFPNMMKNINLQN